jgi:hypothetical protein
MKEAEVDMHVLSNTPRTFLYNVDGSLNAMVAALQNDQAGADPSASQAHGSGCIE